MAAAPKKKRTSGAAEPVRPSDDVMAQLTDFESAVVTVLVETVPGDVMSYGEVAAEAGYPGAARAVGNVLKRVDDLPWWRVVTAAGRLIPHHPVEQARRLKAEGVPTADGKVTL
jgi:methylated-DNA-protein-cysteine methyltransferase-like protein